MPVSRALAGSFVIARQTSQKQNISVLTDAQKAKLNVLNDAMKLAPTISEAQYLNLLGSAGSPPFFFNTAGFFVSGVSGCGSQFPGNVIPANRIDPVAP